MCNFNTQVYKVSHDTVSLIGIFQSLTIFQDETVLIERGLFSRKDFPSLIDGPKLYITQTDWYTNKTTILKRCLMKDMSVGIFPSTERFSIISMRLSFKAASIVYKWESLDIENQLLDMEEQLEIMDYIRSQPPRERGDRMPRRRPPII